MARIISFISIFVISLVLAFSFPSYLRAQTEDNYPPDNVDVVLEKTNLPIVILEVGGVISRDERLTARMKIINNVNGINYLDTINHPGQKFDYDGLIALRYRGNSSFTSSKKKPYSIKTIKDSLGHKRDVSILGMGSDDNWCLIAPYNDKSLIKDVLSLSLAEGYFEYVPKARLCEVVLNGIYYGVYVFTEKVRKGKNRLNIKKPGNTGDELTGGYLLEVDRNDEPTFTSKYNPMNSNGEIFYEDSIFFQYKNPEYEDITNDQRKYIQSRINDFEDALYSDGFTSPEFGYRKFIDVQSFIDYQLSQEISNNIDGYRLSTYIYKYRDSKDPRFKMTIWDFNIAWGSCESTYIHTGRMTDKWSYLNNDEGLHIKMPFWFQRLMQDEQYVRELKQRYSQYRREKYSDIISVVDSLVSVLEQEGAADRNFKAWPSWGIYLWPNYYTSTSYEDEISYMKGWITERLKWLDSQLLNKTSILEIDNTITDSMHVFSIQGTKRETIEKGLNILKTKNGARKIFVR